MVALYLSLSFLTMMQNVIFIWEKVPFGPNLIVRVGVTRMEMRRQYTQVIFK